MKLVLNVTVVWENNLLWVADTHPCWQKWNVNACILMFPQAPHTLPLSHARACTHIIFGLVWYYKWNQQKAIFKKEKSEKPMQLWQKTMQMRHETAHTDDRNIKMDFSRTGFRLLKYRRVNNAAALLTPRTGRLLPNFLFYHHHHQQGCISFI